MSEEKKMTITNDQRLQVFGLMALANQRYIESRQYEAALTRMLGADDSGNLNDHLAQCIFDDEALKEAAFNTALDRAGIVVEASDGEPK